MWLNKKTFDNSKINQKKLEVYPNVYKYTLNNEDYLVLISASTKKVYDVAKISNDNKKINPFIKKSIIEKWDNWNKKYKKVYNTPWVHQVLKHHYALKNTWIKPKNYPNNLSWNYYYTTKSGRKIEIEILNGKVLNVFDENKIPLESIIKAWAQKMVNAWNTKNFERKKQVKELYLKNKWSDFWKESIKTQSENTKKSVIDIINNDNSFVKNLNLIYIKVTPFEKMLLKLNQHKKDFSENDILNSLDCVNTIISSLKIKTLWEIKNFKNKELIAQTLKKLRTIISPRWPETPDLKQAKTNIFNVFNIAYKVLLSVKKEPKSDDFSSPRQYYKNWWFSAYV